MYHATNTSDNISDFVVEEYINHINQFYATNNVHIRLYLRCNVNHIINNLYYNGVNGNNYQTMFSAHYTPNTMNIHFTNEADGFARGQFPWRNNPYSCYIPTDFTNPFIGNSVNDQLANTLIHELGHALGLIHTHEGSRGHHTFNRDNGNCYQESVSRTRSQNQVHDVPQNDMNL